MPRATKAYTITSSDGPGPGTVVVNGVERRFYDYIARGAPFGPDDGSRHFGRWRRAGPLNPW
jgi:hypothetical protein